MSKSSSKLSMDSSSISSAMAVIAFLEAALGAPASFLREFFVFLGMIDLSFFEIDRHFDISTYVQLEINVRCVPYRTVYGRIHSVGLPYRVPYSAYCANSIEHYIAGK